MEDNIPVVEATEVECLVAYLTFELKRVHDYLFAVTYSEDWKTWTLPEQLAFRELIETLNGVTAVHKEKFDADVWKGHANGTVNIAVKSIRAERTGDTPGKKAAPITAESILAKRLKK